MPADGWGGHSWTSPLTSPITTSAQWFTCSSSSAHDVNIAITAGPQWVHACRWLRWLQLDLTSYLTPHHLSPIIYMFIIICSRCKHPHNCRTTVSPCLQMAEVATARPHLLPHPSPPQPNNLHVHHHLLLWCKMAVGPINHILWILNIIIFGKMYKEIQTSIVFMHRFYQSYKELFTGERGTL